MTSVSAAPIVHIPLTGGRSYSVQFGPLDTLPALMEECGLRRGRCIVITDSQVARLYRPAMAEALEPSGWSPRIIEIPAGERSKRLATLSRIYDTTLSWKIDRRTPVIALGGGVVGDLAGFAAATLLRGLPLIHVPTTLIAQVDSAIGGKTGINHSTGKNLIGTFYQPVCTLADLTVLTTLSEIVWTSGLAEVVKHALIEPGDFIDDLENHWSRLVQRDTTAVSAIVPRAAAIKAAIVSEDEQEANRRAVLNLGHTFGHAIERIAGYGTFTHGEAVALGMRAALHLSDILHSDFPRQRTMALVERIPVRASLTGYSVDALMDAMYYDKKVEAGELRLILLRTHGDPYVASGISPMQIRAAWETICR